MPGHWWFVMVLAAILFAVLIGWIAGAVQRFVHALTGKRDGDIGPEEATALRP